MHQTETYRCLIFTPAHLEILPSVPFILSLGQYLIELSCPCVSLHLCRATERLKDLQKDVWHPVCSNNILFSSSLLVLCFISQPLFFVIFSISSLFSYHFLLSDLHRSITMPISDLPSLRKATNLSNSMLLSDFHGYFISLMNGSIPSQIKQTILAFWSTSACWIFH